MPIELKTRTMVRFTDSSHEWAIANDLVIEVNGIKFVKLRSHDRGLIRIICCDGTELPTNPSLANLPGTIALLGKRSDKHMQEFAREEGSKGAAALYDDAPAPPKRKKRSHDEIKRLRANASVMHIDIPAVGTFGATEIAILRPVGPRDDLCIEMNADTIERVVMFIRDAGVTTDMLATKRHYKSIEEKGAYKRPKGFVVRLERPDGKSQLKRVPTIMAALMARNREVVESASPDAAETPALEESVSHDDAANSEPAEDEADDRDGEHGGDGCGHADA